MPPKHEPKHPFDMKKCQIYMTYRVGLPFVGECRNAATKYYGTKPDDERLIEKALQHFTEYLNSQLDKGRDYESTKEYFRQKKEGTK